MKIKILIALTTLAGFAAAHADVAFSISFGAPRHYHRPAPVVCNPPVVYTPPPVVYAPAPVAYTPITVAPAPVIAPAPVCVQPTPVVVIGRPWHSHYRHYPHYVGHRWGHHHW